MQDTTNQIGLEYTEKAQKLAKQLANSVGITDIFRSFKAVTFEQNRFEEECKRLFVSGMPEPLFIVEKCFAQLREVAAAAVKESYFAK